MKLSFDSSTLQRAKFHPIGAPNLRNLTPTHSMETNKKDLVRLHEMGLIVKEIEFNIPQNNFLVIEHAIYHLKALLDQVQNTHELRPIVEMIEQQITQLEWSKCLYHIKDFNLRRRQIKQKIDKEIELDDCG
ncbi:MAG: hypothetical protein ACOH5I_18825 [Oligoflexus sp.]